MNLLVRPLVTALAAATVLAVGATAPANAQTKYANCTALHKDFKHGVAKL